MDDITLDNFPHRFIANTRRQISRYAKHGDATKMNECIKKVNSYRNVYKEVILYGGLQRNFKESDPFFAIHDAFKGAFLGKQTQIIDHLIAKRKANLYTARHIAIEQGNLWAFTYLLGFRPFQLHKQLLASARYGKLKISKLIASKIPKSHHFIFFRALIMAIPRNHFQSVSFFVKRANLNEESFERCLSLAKRYNHTKIIHFLERYISEVV